MRTQQDRTIIHMNMHLCSAYDCKDGMWPEIEPTYAIPNGLCTFCVADSHRHPDEFCHFYIDDYRFERVWDRPENYVNVLSRYGGVIAPDFSTYTDMPVPMQMWNVYRSRALTQYWQRMGLEVIPNIQFSDERSYEWAFEGLPKYSVLSTSTVGCYRNPTYRAAIVKGLEEAVRRLEPAALVMYGTKVEFDPMGAEVYWYRNDNSARVKANIAKAEGNADVREV